MANDACAAGGGVHDGDHVTELGFEGGVEVGGASTEVQLGAALGGDEAVRVCELG
jgi:hypothetical protein